MTHENLSADNGCEAPVIFVVSDSLGETAEFVGRAAASQFNSEQVEVRRIPFVSDREHLEEIVEEAKSCRSIIAFTLVIPELREYLKKLAEENDIPAVDILGPMLEAISRITQKPPKLEPGLMRRLDEYYFNKVEAIEFAVKYDDGKDPKGILRADVVLIGVSRTSKTPVCMYLAHKRIKAANVPLMPEVTPPEELFQIPKNRVIGLTINPKQLYQIRQERLKTIGLSSGADYASYDRILKELDYAEEVMKRIGCPIIDVTNRAVEETASKILEIYYKGERHGS